MRTERHRFRPTLEDFESRDLPSPVLPSSMLIRPDVTIHARESAPTSGEWDRARFPDERAENSPRDYPLLGGDYEVLAPSSDRYNCIAFSLGYRDRWISPRTGPAGSPFRWADRLYGEHGYHRLPTLDMSPVPGERKVALLGYTSRNGAVTAVKHATLQRQDGTWASKLGQDSLIRHPFANSVAGPSYGKPIAVYARTT